MTDFLTPSYKLEVFSHENPTVGYDVTETVNPFIQSLEYDSIDGMADEMRLVLSNVKDSFENEYIFTDSKIFQPGNEINLYLGYSDELEFVGRVKIVRPTYNFTSNDTPTLEVIGYTRDFEMMDTQSEVEKPMETNTPEKQSYIVENVVRSTVSNYKQSFRFDFNTETTVNLPTIQKAGTSDYEYIKGHANSHGYLFWVDGNETGIWTLHFIKPDPKTGLIPNTNQEQFELVYDRGDFSNLIEFSPEFIIRGTKQTIKVLSRNPYTGVALSVDVTVEDDSDPPDTTTKGSTESEDKIQIPHPSREALVKIVFNDEYALEFIPNKPFTDPKELERWARQWWRRNRQEFIEGRGRIVGTPKIMARQTHKLVGMGKSIDGEYYFPRVRHIMSADGGYETEFDARRVLNAGPVE
jgi:phage protein D